ncbi:MAG: helix-turn-helix domain-containing protein [Polyangiaceae bacterium]|nr:helix-turn-helix domain-containing protein [Polyangiaceae bacterium]
MIAHGVVCAGSSRADRANGVVFPAKPNTWDSYKRVPSSWQHAYVEHLWSIRLELKQRGLLLALLRLSDPHGRVWWGQPTLAKHAGCSERTLRRLLPELVKAGHLRSEPMTFKSLHAAQAALGLPLPDRSDDGRAPDLLTLLVDGRPAIELRPVPRPRSKRTMREVAQDEPGPDEPHPGATKAVPSGQVDQGEPRTTPACSPLDRVADDLLDSALLTRNVGVDREEAAHTSSKADGEDREIVAPQSESPLPSALNTPTKLDAWRALNSAYDTHFRRVYHARPTNKYVSRDDEQTLATHLAELSRLFEARLHEHGVDVDAFDEKPVQMLANEALRTWFDTPGGNGFLRRVSHPMNALRMDLPYRVRKAMKALLEKYAPKPEPRRLLAPVVALVSRTMGEGKREVVPDKPTIPLRRWAGPERPPAWQIKHLALPRPSERSSASVEISAETRRILEGLSARSALSEFGAHVSLATELLALARERGGDAERVLGVLDEVNAIVARKGLSSSTAKTNAVFKAAIEVFARDGGGHVEREDRESIAQAIVVAQSA